MDYDKPLCLQVTFSECGERFTGIGEGGVVATWRVDAPRIAASDTGALGRADWCHQVFSQSSQTGPSFWSPVNLEILALQQGCVS